MSEKIVLHSDKWYTMTYPEYHNSTEGISTKFWYTGTLIIKSVSLVFWHADPLLGNDCEISNYTTAVAK
jgi:hypothetical protein